MYKGRLKFWWNELGLLYIFVFLVFMNIFICGFYILGCFVLDKICDKMEYWKGYYK